MKVLKFLGIQPTYYGTPMDGRPAIPDETLYQGLLSCSTEKLDDTKNRMDATSEFERFHCCHCSDIDTTSACKNRLNSKKFSIMDFLAKIAIFSQNHKNGNSGLKF